LPGGLVFCLGLLVVAEHRADEFEGTHHVAVVGERYGGHLMPGCRVDERIDRGGGLQDRKLAVVVQMGAWRRLEQLFGGLWVRARECLAARGLLFAQSFGCRLQVNVTKAYRLYGLRMPLAEFREITRVYLQLLGSKGPPPNQFQKTPRGGLHVGS